MSVYYDSGQDKTDHYGGGGHRTASNNLGAGGRRSYGNDVVSLRGGISDSDPRGMPMRVKPIRVKMPQPKINVRKGKPNVNFKWMA